MTVESDTAIERVARIISSTSRSRSLPKKISLPTKKVGEPKAPRATERSVLPSSRALIGQKRSVHWMRQWRRRDYGLPGIGRDEEVDLRLLQPLRENVRSATRFLQARPAQYLYPPDKLETQRKPSGAGGASLRNLGGRGLTEAAKFLCQLEGAGTLRSG
jgi:hypothetical protein